MGRRFFIAGFTFGLIGIVLGAFATHGLKPLLSTEAIISFETGVRSQIYHSLLLLIIGILKSSGKFKKLNFKLIFYLLVFGILLFSGSIFLLSTNDLTSIDFKFLGPVTPVGGSLLIFCWIILLIGVIKLKKK